MFCKVYTWQKDMRIIGRDLCISVRSVKILTILRRRFLENPPVLKYAGNIGDASEIVVKPCSSKMLQYFLRYLDLPPAQLKTATIGFVSSSLSKEFRTSIC